MASLLEIRQLFFVECEEQLEQLNDGLSEVADSCSGQDVETEIINTMFRAVHSIKGGAASFSLDAIVRFAHVFETVLDEVRGGELKLTPDIVQAFFRGADYLADLVALGAVDDVPEEEELEARIKEISGASEKILGSEISQPGKPNTFKPVKLDFDFSADIDREHQYYIEFVPTKKMYENGHEPVLLIRELSELGQLSVKAKLGCELAWDKPEPDMSWMLDIKTSCTEHEIREIFEFAEEFAILEISEINSEIKDRSLAKSSDFEDKKNSGVEVFRKNPKAEIKNKNSSENLNIKATSKPVSKATVRVDLALVDDLINMVGELVITQSVMTQSIHLAGLTSERQMANTLEDFKNLTRQIQEGIMAIRAQSVKPLFQRMGRIVRETAQIAEKEVRFAFEGEETEVDRTVIERLVDPLTHIIRNSIDHGLEHADKRIEAGKDAVGTVTLSAAHRSGRVVIEVKDDGGGVDRAKVLASAIDKGIVEPAANLTPSEIDWLLFTPGFSTAKAITNLSGRGVGMDVVNNEIRKLGGRVAIFSEEGKGTTISISLPLTLAVLDGMIVDVAGQTMVVPISAIVETIRPEIAQLHWIGPSARMITVRDMLIPVIELAGIFAQDSGSALERDGVLLLVENDQGDQCALAVDKIYDQRQVVIKSLESNYGHVPFVAAATILGDGQIALIVDLDEITLKRAQTGTMSPQSFGVSA